MAPADTSFIYTYDFGDDWEHVITVESIDPVEAGAHYPRCIAGRRAGPPRGLWRLPRVLRLGRSHGRHCAPP
ncbi:MAG: IS1096 element passenger TnpR family protein [Actinomycetota bacterium]